MENMEIKQSYLKVKVYNNKGLLPFNGTKGAAAVDIHANLKLVNPNFMFGATMLEATHSRAVQFSQEGDNFNWKADNLYLELNPGGRVLIPTGLHIDIPVGFKANVRPRSGLALKNGITVLNSPGLIDEDYRGDVGVILINHSNEYFVIQDGDRIAQLEIEPVTKFEWELVDSITKLSPTDRGEGGFGSTGK